MVHQYKLNGYNIVLDMASGSIHAVDEVAYDVIGLYKQADETTILSTIANRYGVSEAEVRECLEDVRALEQEGKLFSEDAYENMAFDFKKRPTVVKAL